MIDLSSHTRSSTPDQPGATGTETEATAGPDESDEGTTHLSLDMLFEALKNERRRRVLRFLLSDSERVTLSDLAEHIASLENDKPIRALRSDERKRVYVCLYQAHLPKLGSMGLVEFNKDRGIIEAGPNLPTVETYLDPETEETRRRPWHVYYGCITATGGLAVLAAALVSGGVVLAVLAAVVIAFGTCALAHVRKTLGDDDEESGTGA